MMKKLIICGMLVLTLLTGVMLGIYVAQAQKNVHMTEYAIRIIGGVSMVLAALGIRYNALSFRGVFKPENRWLMEDKPHFRTTYLAMSMVCVLCYLILFGLGFQMIRLKSQYCLFFLGLIAFEVIYFLLTAAFVILLLRKDIGRSAGAAFGVANGGLVYQFLTLFPIWAPIVVLWHLNSLS